MCHAPAPHPSLCLPTEILIEIFDHVGPLDQLSLAFVCKHLLQVSALVSLKTSAFIGESVSRHSSTMEKLLRRIKPLMVTGRPKKAWQICIDCLQYRLTKKSHWKKLTKLSENWEGLVAGWNNGYLLQCPECWHHERTAVLSRSTASAYL